MQNENIRIYQTQGGMGINFLRGLLYNDDVYYNKYHNEYLALKRKESFIYDFDKQKIKKLDKGTDIKGQTEKMYVVVSENNNTINRLKFIKNIIGGCHVMGNYEHSKQCVIDFNKKHKVDINPYSILCCKYFDTHKNFIEADFISFIKHMYQECKTMFDPHASIFLLKLQTFKLSNVNILYYEDLIQKQIAIGTPFEGYEKEIKRYNDLNEDLIKRYGKIIEWD